MHIMLKVALCIVTLHIHYTCENGDKVCTAQSVRLHMDFVNTMVVPDAEMKKDMYDYLHSHCKHCWLY